MICDPIFVIRKESEGLYSSNDEPFLTGKSLALTVLVLGEFDYTLLYKKKKIIIK